jgi:hypothetical protein
MCLDVSRRFQRKILLTRDLCVIPHREFLESAPHSGAFDWVRQQAHHRLKIWGDSVQAFESRLRLLGPEQVLARG